VVGKDGRRLGSIERLVVDEQAHKVTHLVVEGRLVGVGRVSALDDEGLRTDLDEEELLKQPEAHDQLVSPPPPHWLAPRGYSLRDFLRIASALIGQEPYVPPVHLDLDLSAVHDLAEIRPVWSGGQKVGEVLEVLITDGDRVRALVVQRPGLLGTRHVMPVGHVTEVVGWNVHVDLTELEIEGLPQPSS